LFPYTTLFRSTNAGRRRSGRAARWPCGCDSAASAVSGPSGGGAPGRITAEQVGDVAEAVRPQQGGGDRRAHAALAVDDGRPGRIEVAEVVEQRRQRDRRAAVDHAALQLAG